MSLTATMDFERSSGNKRGRDELQQLRAGVSHREESPGVSPEKRVRIENNHMDSLEEPTADSQHLPRRPLSPTLQMGDSESNDSQSLLHSAAVKCPSHSPNGSTNTLEIEEDEIKEMNNSVDGPVSDIYRQSTLEYSMDTESIAASAGQVNSIRPRTGSTDSQGFTPCMEPQPADSSCSSKGKDGHSAANCNKLNVPHGIEKIASVQRDAEIIAEMLDSKNLTVLYEKILKRRKERNRIEIVTNEVLEEPEVLLEKQKDGKDEMAKFIDDIDKIVNILKKEHKLIQVDANEVYALLESSVNHLDRVDRVVDAVLQRQKRESMSLETQGDEAQVGSNDDIFSQVERVMKECPDADANEVYSLLEKRDNTERRVAIVIGFLEDRKKRRDPVDKAQDRTSTLLQAKKESITSDQFIKDMKIIADVFPDRDENEIYSQLESYHDKPNRVQLVIRKMMEVPEASQEASIDDTLTLKMTTGAGTLVKQPSEDPVQRLADDVELLKTMFPDCDPDYLYNELESMFETAHVRVSVISARMLENRNYPKLNERLEKERRSAVLKRMQNMEVNIKEFLQAFPDPADYFYDISKPVNGLYRTHATAHLQNTYPFLHKKYIEKKLEEFSGHFTPTLRALDPIAAEYFSGNGGKKYRLTPRTSLLPMPEVPDEHFYKELLFTRNEKEIQDYIQKKKDEKEMRYKLAEERGELLECTCCYDDKVLFEDMQACPDGHIFCQECICRSAEAALSEAKANFRCLQGECELQFSHKVLQMVLPPAKFSVLLRRVQEEEIRLADIPDLVSCPFCSFATIMNEGDGKVLHCLNPECLKESCRLCKESNHVPLRCEEVEKQSETSMRAYIEAVMTEAMLRTCHQCKKRFFKTEGCNKMTCVCGASMCYVCRQPVNDYEHFDTAGERCNNAMAEQLHKEEMETAAATAKAEYLRDHPEAAGIEMKYDPLKLLNEHNAHPRGYISNDDDGDIGFDEEDDLSSDEDF